MKATEASLVSFLREPKQFIVPIYQRSYSWSRTECRQFWEDIVRVAVEEDIAAHFVGSIVYIEKGIYQVSSIPQLLVIDGQQRLTTLTLLLTALSRALTQEDENDKTARRITNYYLTNQDEDKDLYHKLVLTRSDREALFNIINEVDIPEQSTDRIYDNYRLFQRFIRQADVDLLTIYKGIEKLLIVDVSLDRNYDNPQLIFESLNSTGLDLTEADLIRNYILMGLEAEKQNRLYEQYWYRMEQDFGQQEYAKQFDDFIRSYLTVKSPAGDIPAFREIYARFKTFVRDDMREVDIEHVVSDIRKYARYYVRLAFPERFVEDKDIKRILANIRDLKATVSYPFLMEVFDDYEQSKLNRDELIEILQLVESYIFRRAICGIPTNSLNKTFATLKRDLNKEDYLRSVQMAFMAMDSYRRFPKDEEFWFDFQHKDVYNFARRNYLFSSLENYGRKEHVNVSEYTIEHIMPQNKKLSPEWKNMLGESWKQDHEQYLHTIGNLTLTGYNSELSDRTFLEKRNMEGGFADSPFRLNHSLRSLDTWNRKNIENRAQELADRAISIWKIPDISTEEVTAYYFPKRDQPDVNSFDQYEHLHGEMRELFEILREEILGLGVGVREELLKLYIAYKTTTNFVDIVPQSRRLRLSLNMKFDQIDDPRGICNDVSNKGRWGNGDVEFGFSFESDLEYAMYLIKQSYEYHTDDVGV